MATKRVAIYARVSTSDQHSDMQLVELREHASRRGWTIAGEYVDEGVSGTKSSRPELDKLMGDARRRRFDLVMVWRFDRFARSTSHLLSALEEFRNLGVDFASLNEAIDTSTPMGKMVFTIVASVAELERSIIVERVRAGLARAKANGKRLGRPIGSKINARRVSELTAAGRSIRQIADQMSISLGSVSRARRLCKKTMLKSGIATPMAGKAR